MPHVLNRGDLETHIQGTTIDPGGTLVSRSCPCKQVVPDMDLAHGPAAEGGCVAGARRSGSRRVGLSGEPGASGNTLGLASQSGIVIRLETATVAELTMVLAQPRGIPRALLDLSHAGLALGVSIEVLGDPEALYLLHPCLLLPTAKRRGGLSKDHGPPAPDPSSQHQPDDRQRDHQPPEREPNAGQTHRSVLIRLDVASRDSSPVFVASLLMITRTGDD
jgi:hypothetical protein